MAKDRQLPDWILNNVPPELVGTTLFRFRILTQAKNEQGDPVQVEVDLLPDLDLSIDQLEQQMQDLPSQYEFWAALYSELRMTSAIAERKLKARKAVVTKKIIEDGAAVSVKFTADQIKTIVESDTELQNAELRFERAQMHAGKLYHMLEALKMKAELARSLAPTKRMI